MMKVPVKKLTGWKPPKAATKQPSRVSSRRWSIYLPDDTPELLEMLMKRSNLTKSKVVVALIRKAARQISEAPAKR